MLLVERGERSQHCVYQQSTNVPDLIRCPPIFDMHCAVMYGLSRF